MATIYRYEDKTGEGPYRCDRVERNVIDINILHNAHNNAKKRPAWGTDFKSSRMYASKYLSGCLTIKDLKKWFWGFNPLLKKHEFFIVKYNVKDLEIGKSKKQIRFYKDDIISKERVN